jgi:hypothetical protein
MSTFKRVNSDYNIVTLGDFNIRTVVIEEDSALSQNNVSIEAHTVRVHGNLDVVGDVTYINVSELNIKDPFIQLNSIDIGNNGPYASNSGIITHRTDTVFAGLRYNDDTANWEITSETDTTGLSGNWEVLATANAAATAAGSNTEIQFNQDGVFGASEDLTFDFDNNILTLQGNFNVADTVSVGSHQVFANRVTAPDAVANSVALYHNQEAGGGTGLYVKTDTVEEELVSKAKAIVYSIIF